MSLSALCQLYGQWGKPHQSAVWDQRLLAVLEKQYGPGSPVLVSTPSSEAKALRHIGHTGEAR
jgi:hypothetical protein